MQSTDKAAPAAVFSILHDGEIIAHAWTDDALVLTVNILYLAELLDPTFRALTVELRGARDLHFRTWPSAQDAPPAELVARSELDAVLGAEPDILSATWSAETARTTVVLNQSSPTPDYCGGELSFQCDEIIVRAPSGTACTVTELGAVAKRYWDAFGARPSTST